MLGSIPKARFPESCISDGTSGLGCPARAMRLQGRRKTVDSGERKSCIRENICRQWSCVWRRVGQEQLGVCIYQPSSARSSAGVVYGQHSCTFTPVMPVFLLSVLSLASAALCAPLRETGWARRASKKGKGVQKQTSRQKRDLIPRNGA